MPAREARALPYNNRAIATQEVIEELIKLAKQMSAATQRGVDRTVRESARAKIKVMVKRILRKHGYPPDLQDEATKTVLAQAELLCVDWAEAV